MGHVDVLGVSREGDAATCLHTNEGSLTVFANGRGVTRVEGDDHCPGPDQGWIIGPGSQNVIVEGHRMSLDGDTILGHSHDPFPESTQPQHNAATTDNASTTIFASRGFVGMGGSEPNIDLVASLDYDHIVFYTSGLNYFPPQSQHDMWYSWWWCCYASHGQQAGTATPWECYNSIPSHYGEDSNTWGELLTVPYTVKNIGISPSEPFTVGLYEVPTNNSTTIVEYLHDPAHYPANIELLGQDSVGVLGPGEEYHGDLNLALLEPGSLQVGQYYYQVYPDIHGTNNEIDESNASNVVRVDISLGCRAGGPTGIPDNTYPPSPPQGEELPGAAPDSPPYYY